MGILKRTDKRKIGEILSEDFGVPGHYVEEILKRMANSPGKEKFGEVASALGLISEEKVYSALARQFEVGGEKIDFVSYIKAKYLFNFNLFAEKEINEKFGGEKAMLESVRTHGCFPAMIRPASGEGGKNALVVAITKVSGEDLNYFGHLLRYKSFAEGGVSYAGMEIEDVEFVLVSPKTMNRFMLLYKGVKEEELARLKEETDTLTYLKAMLTYAIVNEASDIHVEPSSADRYRLSMRFLSFRKTVDFLETPFTDSLVNLIKQGANISMGSDYKPKDGVLPGGEMLGQYVLPVKRHVKPEFSFPKTSFRVSTYPVAPSPDQDPDTVSESVVLRILSSDAAFTEPEELGLSEETIKELRFSSSRNQGLVVIVGPTGSGKTTTLYSVLSKVDAIKKKIISFEDPVEIRNIYWAQGQKRESETKETTFDFSDAARAILRQDPDVILVGEVRDEETASFAMKAANTGHLVFTTLHANNAAATFPRLKDLGVKGSDAAISVLCVISQRLVRKLCPECSREDMVTDTEREYLERMGFPSDKIPEKTKRVGKGCVVCGGTGYVGREVIDEAISLTRPEIKNLVSADATEYEIRKKADELGYGTIIESGMKKVEEGITGIDEILRVV